MIIVNEKAEKNSLSLSKRCLYTLFFCSGYEIGYCFLNKNGYESRKTDSCCKQSLNFRVNINKEIMMTSFQASQNHLQ